MLTAAAIFPSRRMGAPTQRAPKVRFFIVSAYPRFFLIFSILFGNRDKWGNWCEASAFAIGRRQHISSWTKKAVSALPIEVQ